MGRFGVLWEAEWIWSEAVPGSDRVLGWENPPPQTWNRWCHLRKSIILDEAPDEAWARFTADGRAVVFVNGVEVGRGPSRSVPERLTWAELDLAPHLRAGENVVATLVRFYGKPIPWWVPARPMGALGYGSFAFECPSIDLRTDGTWRGRPAAYTAPADTGHLHGTVDELLDGREWPAGWTEPGFDDGAWGAAAVLKAGVTAGPRRLHPTDPFAAPEHDGIRALTAHPIEFHPVGDGRPGVHESNVGITLATPWVEVRGTAGDTVVLSAGEQRTEEGDVEIRPRIWSATYTLRGGDEPERFDAFEAVGFRYLQARTTGTASVLRVGAVERRYPRAGSATFESNDEQLDAIWKAGARTLDLCATDAFLDCPGREQRAWVGDSYVHTLLTMVTNTDWRLIGRHLHLCAQAPRADGLLPMVAAGDLSRWPFTIPDYSLHWIRALYQYVIHSNDAAVLDRLLPVAFGVVDAFERFRADDGLLRGLPSWLFVDWAMTERAEVTGALDALYAMALPELAALAILSGYADRRVDQLQELGARSRDALDLLWDEERGVYVDAATGSVPHRRVSQQTNAVAILAGCPADRVDRILDYVLDEDRLVRTPTPKDHRERPDSGYGLQWEEPGTVCDFDPEVNVVLAEPFFAHFVHQAVAEAGRRHLLPDLCRRWAFQVATGDGTLHEQWTAPLGTQSRAHAWSATATYDLTTHVLGVRPTELGYRAAVVDPVFAGGLTRMRGIVPTPHGDLEVDVTTTGGTVCAPAAVTVSSPLPGVTVDYRP